MEQSMPLLIAAKKIDTDQEEERQEEMVVGQQRHEHEHEQQGCLLAYSCTAGLYCSECGERLGDEEDKFCGGCGKPRPSMQNVDNAVDINGAGKKQS
jgi:YgiT-type zinc finger domain-containing protein